MKVIRALAMGMCFGVRDALQEVDRTARPEDVTIYGELVHNEVLLDDLRRRGFHSLGEGERDRLLNPQPPSGTSAGTRANEPDEAGLAMTPLVMITAHGISNTERKRLEDAGKTLVDTTCPLVKRVHHVAQKWQSRGYFLVVIGKADHVEVRGLVGDLTDYAVVPDVASVKTWDAPALAVIMQTTTQPAHAKAVCDAIKGANPGKEIQVIDTICRPTRDRQEALVQLLDRVQALVVVGGMHSNNTRQLAQSAQDRGIPALRIANAAELDPAWLDRHADCVIGLTAGTSTLDATIDEVHHVLVHWPASGSAAAAASALNSSSASLPASEALSESFEPAIGIGAGLTSSRLAP